MYPPRHGAHATLKFLRTDFIVKSKFGGPRAERPQRYGTLKNQSQQAGARGSIERQPDVIVFLKAFVLFFKQNIKLKNNVKFKKYITQE